MYSALRCWGNLSILRRATLSIFEQYFKEGKLCMKGGQKVVL